MITKVEVLRSVADRFWEMACKYDQIPRHSATVAFSESNPFLELYNKTMLEFQKLQKEIRQNG